MGKVSLLYSFLLGQAPQPPKPTRQQPQTPLPTTERPAVLPSALVTTASAFVTTTVPGLVTTVPGLITTLPAFAPTTPGLGALSHTRLTPSPGQEAVGLVFLLEGSDEVGEENFNRTRDSLIEVVTLLEEEWFITVTIIQYSETVTVEISSMELHRRQALLERMRQITYAGGSKTNTGEAVRSLYETSTTERPTHAPDQLVFLITENPPTDTIERPPSSAHTQVFPVVIGPKVREEDLEPLSHPDKPIMFQKPEDLTQLRPLLWNLTHHLKRPVLPSLAPLPKLPPSGQLRGNSNPTHPLCSALCT